MIDEGHGLTLAALLERAAGAHEWLILPTQPRSSDRAVSMAFADVATLARRRARCLAARGASPGRACVLMFDNDPDFVVSFFAAQLVGMICVPWHLPSLTARNDDFSLSLGRVSVNCDAQFILTTAALERRVGTTIDARAELLAVESLDQGAQSEEGFPRASAHDIAVIQYTSGSTGSPKGVELTHAAILANVEAIGRSVEVNADDIMLGWLPMFHDMGLFGTMVFSLFWRIRFVMLSPRLFLLRPENWLWAMSRFAATLCPAPNFAYQMCASSIKEKALDGLDLRAWRVAFNGAESVRFDTCRAFIDRFSRYGFSASALFPVYGLAENVLAVCFPQHGTGARFDWVDRARLSACHQAKSVSRELDGAMAVACVGRPLSSQRVRITQGTSLLDERLVGEIEIEGPCTFTGYHRNVEATLLATSHDGWLRTGDLGYLVDGELYVVGRSKATIKHAGRNFYCADIEGELAKVEGVAAGYVAACAWTSVAHGTEEIAILVELRRPALDEAALKAAIASRVRETFGVTPSKILLIAKGALPRTTSGKIRHAVCSELLALGKIYESSNRSRYDDR